MKLRTTFGTSTMIFWGKERGGGGAHNNTATFLRDLLEIFVRWVQ